MEKLISLELNEVNFDLVAKYCARGHLPTFSRALRDFQLFRTWAEDKYPELEPWIQWPTVYTGKPLAEHGVFRLGDIVEKSHVQIWEALESYGISVGAISPMNAANRCRRADFFIPDPWTLTKVAGGPLLQRLHALVQDVVNSNAHEERSAIAIGKALLPLFVRYASMRSAGEYLRIMRDATKYKWARAIFLDRFLADVFLKLRAQHRTQFASVFLNAGAHIQHHYMYDSAVYDGDQRNPDWYSTHRTNGVDPLLQVLRAYDRILAEMLALKGTRLLVTTGLSQYPNPKVVYQYRFKDHRATLGRLGLSGASVVPRMSRDFLAKFGSESKAAAAEQQMNVTQIAGKSLFSVENRGNSLFCQIAYFGPAEAFRTVTVADRTLSLLDDVALVSIENGIHQATGFHLDTAVRAGDGEPTEIPLTDVFLKMRSAFSDITMDAPADPSLRGPLIAHV